MKPSMAYRFLKRLFDICASGLALIVLIPVFYAMRSTIGQIQAVLLYQPLVFFASVLSVALLRRVPVFNKLL